MPKLTIEVDLSDHLLHAYQREAERRGKKVEELVEKLVTELVREMEREINDPEVLIS